MPSITTELISKRVRLAKVAGLSITLMVGVYGAYIRWGVVQDARKMIDTGTTETALVVDKKHWTEKGRKNRDVDKYALVYQFKTPDGMTHAADLIVRENEYEAAASGAPIPVIYEPNNPDHNEPVERCARKASLPAALRDVGTVIAILLAMTYGIALGVGARMRKQMDLERAAA